MIRINLTILLALSLCFCASQTIAGGIDNKPSEDKKTIVEVTDNGTWCWFSDPRAIYVHGSNPGVITGWVTSDGSIEVAKINLNGGVSFQNISPRLEVDDHANPAFIELLSGQQAVFYTKHFDDCVRYHLNDGKDWHFGEATLHDPFDEDELKKFPLKRTTYSNPFVLSEELGKVYCFGRWTGFKPNMMTSSDNGKSFTKSKVLITNYPFDDENRPYVKYYSDGKSRIHIIFTDGHPRNEPFNSVYYAYYEKGNFWKADGSKICSVEELPFEPKDASVIYKANSEEGKSWIYDVGADKKGNPVVLFAKYPDDLNHIYYYSRFNGKEWIENKICNSGKWFPKTPEGEIEREPNYSGGMALHSIDPKIIYVSEMVNGTFEIVKYNLNKKGKVKSRKQLTTDSKYDNVRPVVPHNMKKGDETVVLWMQNQKYIHYTEYETSILMIKD